MGKRLGTNVGVKVGEKVEVCDGLNVGVNVGVKDGGIVGICVVGETDTERRTMSSDNFNESSCIARRSDHAAQPPATIGAVST